MKKITVTLMLLLCNFLCSAQKSHMTNKYDILGRAMDVEDSERAVKYAPTGIYGIESLIMYSKMRPMAFVKLVTNGAPWSIDSDYYNSNLKMRIVSIVSGQYRMTTRFNDEHDDFVCDMPANTGFYNDAIQYFAKAGLKKKNSAISGNEYNEIWDNNDTDPLHPLMIFICTHYIEHAGIKAYSYWIMMHGE
jgi:hypothetical protein